MNNKEKQKYLADLLVYQSTPFVSEIENWGSFLKNTPTVLYKFRSFDKYAFEMIEDGYSYLSPVKNLDDPFDCLNDFEMDCFYDEKTNKIKPKAIDYLIQKYCPKNIPGFSVQEVKKLVYQCINEDGIDYYKLPKTIISNSGMTKIDIEPFFSVLSTFNQNFQMIFESIKIDGLAKSAMFPGDSVGILSLTEKRDNKVMWSLYGKNYEGYCIEFDIPKQKEITPYLWPVIYTKRSSNSFIKKLLDYAMGAFLRAVTTGQVANNMGAISELFCVKDSDWSYQAEWRLVANAGAKCKLVKIKAIYLGFKVKKSYELKMKKLAKKKGFGLFKMDFPNGKKTISYHQIA